MLRSESDGAVLRLTFADPSRRDVLDYGYVRRLRAALRQADADPDVRAVVLTGEGAAFSAGDPESEAMRWASTLAQSAPTALALGKRLLAHTAQLSSDDAVNHAPSMGGVFLHTPDLAEGVTALLDRRGPDWRTGSQR